MNIKETIKAVAFRPGCLKRRVIGGALKGMYFHFDLRQDTQEWRGLYEQCLQDWLVKNVQPGATCVDIGAASGYFTLLMAKLTGPDGQVYAFEPSDLYERIQPNFDVNAGEALAQPKIFEAFVVGTKTDEANAITIDELVDRENLTQVDVVKIDVDGGEADVLQGMSLTLTRFHPKLFIEVHSRELLAQVQAVTTSLGYKMRMEEPPPRELRPIEFNTFLFSEE